MAKKDEQPIRCSFCGKRENQARLIAGPGVYICSECVKACSELLQVILERAYPKEIARQIPVQGPAETNLISSAAYGQRHGKSQEQVKQYCHGNRIHGAVRIGRDWVIPRDSRFPEDHRKMGSK